MKDSIAWNLPCRKRTRMDSNYRRLDPQVCMTTSDHNASSNGPPVLLTWVLNSWPQITMPTEPHTTTVFAFFFVWIVFLSPRRSFLWVHFCFLMSWSCFSWVFWQVDFWVVFFCRNQLCVGVTGSKSYLSSPVSQFSVLQNDTIVGYDFCRLETLESNLKAPSRPNVNCSHPWGYDVWWRFFDTAVEGGEFLGEARFFCGVRSTSGWGGIQEFDGIRLIVSAPASTLAPDCKICVCFTIFRNNTP